MSDNNFSVDLHGVVELLSSHLYSGPQVFIRELLQNGVDAVTARVESDQASSEEGSVTFTIGADGKRPTLAVTDEGLGLTADEAQQFMSVIGRSSKRDEIGLARESLIGQFGVGILSCFTVSDDIIVTSQSSKGGPAVRWVGSSDGTWSLSEKDPETEKPYSHPIGSTVVLKARPGEEKYFQREFVAQYLAFYGELLDHKIWLREEGQTPILLSKDSEPLHHPDVDTEATLTLGQELLGFRALDAFPIKSIAGQTQGVAFVVPYEPAPNAVQKHRVYVKGMLVSEGTDRVLPDWTFFIRSVLLSDGLKPTASREELHQDETLSLTRAELGESVREYLLSLAANDPQRLRSIVEVHHGAMKALAIHDPEFLTLVIDWLPIESSQGRTTFGEFRRSNPVAAYTSTVDEFRQLAPIATAQGIGLLCGGYTHDEALIAAAAQHLDDFSADAVQIDDLFSGFGALTPEEEAQAKPLVDIISPRIEALGVELAVRRFEPHETPSLLAMDETATRLRSLRRSQEQSNDLFAAIVGAAAQAQEANSRPMFCLNIANPIVQRLTDNVEAEIACHSVEVLYLQALLMGHHPLGLAETALLNTSLSAIIDTATKNIS